MRTLKVSYKDDDISPLMRQIFEAKLHHKLPNLHKLGSVYIRARIKFAALGMGLILEGFYADHLVVSCVVRVAPIYRHIGTVRGRVSSTKNAIQAITKSFDIETGGIKSFDRVHDPITVKVDPTLRPDQAVLESPQGGRVLIENLATESQDDACKRICTSLLDGHSHGCPYAKEGR